MTLWDLFLGMLVISFGAIFGAGLALYCVVRITDTFERFEEARRTRRRAELADMMPKRYL